MEVHAHYVTSFIEVATIHQLKDKLKARIRCRKVGFKPHRTLVQVLDDIQAAGLHSRPQCIERDGMVRPVMRPIVDDQVDAPAAAQGLNDFVEERDVALVAEEDGAVHGVGALRKHVPALGVVLDNVDLGPRMSEVLAPEKQRGPWDENGKGKGGGGEE